jgi:hypothetical protein
MNSLRIGQVRTAKAAKALAERRYSLTPSVDEELAQCYRDRPKGDYGSEGSWNSAVK